ncbi:IS200/IS605 family transposase [Actinocorallia sp. B10E7]|uniref:IS200/IS605 family transposase n=1 Tax=Actinocorallia sp. B10E7 TaxID=3153558 RepID=UPI00325C6C82
MTPRHARERSIGHSLHVYSVFVTRYRRGILTDALLTRCETVMRDMCARLGGELREFNGKDDRVHLLVHYPPKLPISTLVNRLKRVSVHYLRKEFDQHVRHHLQADHFWSPSYLATSCGGAPPNIIKDYIEQQKRPD